jgi:hypothetical protein
VNVDLLDLTVDGRLVVGGGDAPAIEACPIWITYDK